VTRSPYSYYLENPPSSDRVRKFLDAFATILQNSNYQFVIDLYSRVCARCGRCAEACQIYQATHDPKDIPGYRSNMLLEVYRRHFTPEGWLRSKFLGSAGLTEEKLDEMAESFYHCTACRRCTLDCPMGIDHGLITHLARYALSEAGIAPKGLVVAVREQLEGKTGNTSAIPVPALRDTLEFLEEELLEDKGVPIKFPIDQEDAEYVFFPAVSDYLLEPDTLMGNAAVMHAAGASWTIGSGYFDGINYGLFYNDWVLERIIQKLTQETHRLRGRKILIGECGHASRSAKAFVPTFSDGTPPPVLNIMEFTCQLLESGKLKLDPTVVTERVTYHDPCNIARSGWIIEQPRRTLRAFVKDFVDMTPHGAENYCCGGGGGSVSLDEMHDYRMQITGKLKAEQIRATGASIVVSPCANCKKQLREIVEYYHLPVQVVGLHDLILRAIRF
jgi:Fe-S oxidoreductase